MTDNDSPEHHPQAPFDEHFQEHVGPKLELALRFSASLLHWELETFTQAHARVMQIAHRYGAAHLSDDAQMQLDHWIDQQLLSLVDAAPHEALISPARLAKITGEP